MVTFCLRCGVSLPPSAITLIKDGKEMPSPYYTCPSCGKIAGAEEAAPAKIPDNEDIDLHRELIIKNGKIEPKG